MVIAGDLKLVEKPQPLLLAPHDFCNIKANIKVASTENGIIFGNIGKVFFVFLDYFQWPTVSDFSELIRNSCYLIFFFWSMFTIIVTAFYIVCVDLLCRF